MEKVRKEPRHSFTTENLLLIRLHLKDRCNMGWEGFEKVMSKEK